MYELIQKIINKDIERVEKLWVHWDKYEDQCIAHKVTLKPCSFASAWQSDISVRRGVAYEIWLTPGQTFD